MSTLDLKSAKQVRARIVADAVREIVRRTELRGNDKKHVSLKDARTLAVAHSSADWIAQRYSTTAWKPLTAYVNGLKDRDGLDKAIQRAYAAYRKRTNATDTSEDETKSA